MSECVGTVGGKCDERPSGACDADGPDLCMAYWRFAEGKQRARAEAAEKRVAELELHEQSVDEELFRVLWEDYGSAPDDTLAPSGLKLKRKLREWVGIDAAEEDAEQLAEAVELSRWECEEDMRDIREDDTFTCGGCEGECCKVTALAAHEALKGEK